MAGQQDRVVGQGEYLRADAGRQLVEIAVVKVRPAHAAQEDDIADKRQIGGIVLPNVDNVPRRMAGNFANLQVKTGGRDSISRADRPVGGGLVIARP